MRLCVRVLCCLCVRRKGKNATIEHPAIAPAGLSPTTPPPPVLACTLTYSWSRFGDKKIKAFLCFSFSPLSSFSSVTRALSAGALAVDIESSFKLTQSLFTSCFAISQSNPGTIWPPYRQRLHTGRPKDGGPVFIHHNCAQASEEALFLCKGLTSSIINLTTLTSLQRLTAQYRRSRHSNCQCYSLLPSN